MPLAGIRCHNGLSSQFCTHTQTCMINQIRPAPKRRPATQPRCPLNQLWCAGLLPYQLPYKVEERMQGCVARCFASLPVLGGLATQRNTCIQR